MVGGSAGAMIWGTDIRIILAFNKEMDSMGLTDSAGLGCIPYVVLPHADFLRQGYNHYGETIQQAERTFGEKVLELENEKGALFLDGVLHWV
jgi:peptidase E